ncbi:unnamed protein product [Rhizopus stolonifer]
MVLPNSQTFNLAVGFQFSPPNLMSRLDLTLSKPVFFAPREQMDAFLFNISPCKEKYTDQQSMLLLKEQHPNVHACVPLSDGPRQYLEVYIMPQKDSNDIAQKGLTFPDVNLVVYPRATLGETAKVVDLNLLISQYCQLKKLKVV